MLIKVQFGGKKKYIKLEEDCFLDFFSAVQHKFVIPEETASKATDDHGVVISMGMYFKNLQQPKKHVIHTNDDLTVLQQGAVEVPSSPSLTDTLSVSSSLSSSDSGSQIIQPLMGSVQKNKIEQILTSKPAELTVIKEYDKIFFCCF